MPSARSRSVVGHRQAVTPAPPSSATSSSVRCVACTAVKRSDSAPASASSPVGVRPWVARHSSFSFGCSETCACSGRSRAHSATTRAASGSTARTLWIAAPTRADGRSADRVHALGPRGGVAVAEALDAAVQVARVEQRDPQPGRLRRGEHGAAHRVGVVVGRPVGRVVEVVELADAGDAGERHLPERGAREREARVGIERAGELVHLLAPGPERARAGVRAPAQRALERVRVRVGEPGQRQPVEPVGVGGRAPCRRSPRPAARPRSRAARPPPRARRRATRARTTGASRAEPCAPQRRAFHDLPRVRLERRRGGGGRTAPRWRTSRGRGRGRGTGSRRGGRPRAGTSRRSARAAPRRARRRRGRGSARAPPRSGRPSRAGPGPTGSPR